jgi:carbonic anhydrase
MSPRLRVGRNRSTPPVSVTPSDALERLREGNARFVAARPQHPHPRVTWRADLTTGQRPFAAILGCSDSRVPLELLFDQGFGDLFVIRVAGNVASDEPMGSVVFAVARLQVPLVVVLGHEQCGAITAALAPASERRRDPPEIQKLLARIDPGLKDLAPAASETERIRRGVEANVRWSEKQLRGIPALEDQMQRGELGIAGGVYELESGRVRWLGDAAVDSSAAAGDTTRTRSEARLR